MPEKNEINSNTCGRPYFWLREHIHRKSIGQNDRCLQQPGAIAAFCNTTGPDLCCIQASRTLTCLKYSFAAHNVIKYDQRFSIHFQMTSQQDSMTAQPINILFDDRHIKVCLLCKDAQGDFSCNAFLQHLPVFADPRIKIAAVIYRSYSNTKCWRWYKLYHYI